MSGTRKTPKAEMTPWYPGNVPPARDGVYEKRPKGGPFRWFSAFRNGRWNACTVRGPEQARVYADILEPAYEDESALPWRGLSQPPAPQRKKTP
jgi:hypothetical protein